MLMNFVWWMEAMPYHIIGGFESMTIDWVVFEEKKTLDRDPFKCSQSITRPVIHHLFISKDQPSGKDERDEERRRQRIIRN